MALERMTRMTILDYVEYRKKKGNVISNIAVAKAIRMKHRTPGIKSFEFIGRTYLLYVDLTELDNYLVTIKKPIKLRA
jgi:hypothetical protein